MGWSNEQSWSVVDGVVAELGAIVRVRVPAVVPGPSSYSTAAMAVGPPPPPPWTNSPRVGTSGGAGIGFVTVHQPWSRGASAAAGTEVSPIASADTVHVRSPAVSSRRPHT